MAGGVGIGAKKPDRWIVGSRVQVLVRDSDFVRNAGVLLQRRRRKPQARRQAGNRVFKELNEHAAPTGINS